MGTTNKTGNIPYAIDESGNAVTPPEAVPGTRYKCPFCEVSVHGVNGEHFACFPGEYHRALECEMISKRSQNAKRRLAMGKTNPAALMRKLLAVPEEREDDTPPIIESPEDNNIEVIVEPPEARGPQIIIGPPPVVVPEARPYSTLTALYEDGIIYENPDTPLGKGHLRDCLASVASTISEKIYDSSFEGELIFLANVDDLKYMSIQAISRELVLPFSIFTRNNASKEYVRKILLLEFATEDELLSVIETYFTKAVDDNNREGYTAKCERILIAGDWKIAGCDKCTRSCKAHVDGVIPRACEGAIVAQYHSRKQLLGIPKKRAPKAKHVPDEHRPDYRNLF